MSINQSFTSGCRVRMKYFDDYATGEVILIRRNEITGIHEAKVLFDGPYDLAYWYYPLVDLEVITDESSTP